jgi:autotransporter-associated beta strand protein
LKLNGTGKTVIGASQPNQATIDGALRIGILANRTTSFNNPVELESDAHISVAAANTFGILSNVVSGPGDFIKTGAGKLTLTGANTYTGDTVVNGNILSITNAYLHNDADVYLNTGSTFDLAFSGEDTIRALYIDGMPKETGTWGRTGSGADHESELITSDGLLNVLTQPVVGIPGDYNDNGSVDAADYVLWREGGPLENEVDNPGVVNAQDYLEWRSRFGNPGAGAGLGTSTVPEPTAWLLAVLSLVGHLARRERR